MEENQNNDSKEKGKKFSLPSGRKKLLIFVPLFLFLGVVAWNVFSNNQTVEERMAEKDSVIARVNGKEIMYSEMQSMQERIASNQGIDLSTLSSDEKERISTEALDYLISQALLEQEIGKLDISVSQEEIDAQINSFKEAYGGEEPFREELALQGLTEEQLRDQLELESKLMTYFSQELDFDALSATDDEIKAFYDQSVSQSENVPPFEEVASQLEQYVIQQKQQDLVEALVQQLRFNADIEILL